MCSIEHAFPVIACLLIPGFELRAALLDRPRLALRPAALAPVEGTEPLLGPVTAVAAAAGIRPGMRLGEALATCPSLVLVEQDPARAEQAWEGVLRRLEDAGFAVEPAEPGCVYFETKGVERLAPHEPTAQYRHNNGEDNADAHLKRHLMAHQVVLAITNGKLDLGPWEQVFYAEFDGRRRKRVLLKAIGE